MFFIAVFKGLPNVVIRFGDNIVSRETRRLSPKEVPSLSPKEVPSLSPKEVPSLSPKELKQALPGFAPRKNSEPHLKQPFDERLPSPGEGEQRPERPDGGVVVAVRRVPAPRGRAPRDDRARGRVARAHPQQRHGGRRGGVRVQGREPPGTQLLLRIPLLLPGR
ncbi:hypothetical protein AVEN_208121-1 [Araneus ventricosus]|uniref:Uncharacterized protein n=1 Tax=Araneus ventricosus TaxID=182803 RepID=A0A4Y2I2L1_ARAVE|nr:hypothetical protein AVEN_208121-1 [Araneus ventricosus]